MPAGPALSRFSRSELHRFVVEQAVSQASASTIGRWLAEDAIKPWQRSWIFPRDPDFLEKAGPILDLYEGRWEGKLLEPGDCVDGVGSEAGGEGKVVLSVSSVSRSGAPTGEVALEHRDRLARVDVGIVSVARVDDRAVGHLVDDDGD